MSSPCAYFLVYHGSSDPRPHKAATELARIFSEKINHVQTLSSWVTYSPSVPGLSNPTVPPVGVAVLEGSIPLHQQLGQFVQSLSESPAGSPAIEKVIILPLFLLSGVHVMEDIPAEIALARQLLGPTPHLEIASHLGSHAGLARLVTERMAVSPAEAWVLLSHGSRRPGANQGTVLLADRLGALPAYWSVPPQLEARLQELQASGLRQISVFPYFLFQGGITDAIAQLTEQLARQFPHLQLSLAPPLNALPELADLLIDLAHPTALRAAP